MLDDVLAARDPVTREVDALQRGQKWAAERTVEVRVEVEVEKEAAAGGFGGGRMEWVGKLACILRVWPKASGKLVSLLSDRKST